MEKKTVDDLFRDWYTFIYPLFFLVSDSFKEAYKNQETEAHISSEIPRLFTFFFVLYFYPSSSASLNFLFYFSARWQATQYRKPMRLLLSVCVLNEAASRLKR